MSSYLWFRLGVRDDIRRIWKPQIRAFRIIHGRWGVMQRVRRYDRIELRIFQRRNNFCFWHPCDWVEWFRVFVFWSSVWNVRISPFLFLWFRFGLITPFCLTEVTGKCVCAVSVFVCFGCVVCGVRRFIRARLHQIYVSCVTSLDWRKQSVDIV